MALRYNNVGQPVLYTSAGQSGAYRGRNLGSLIHSLGGQVIRLFDRYSARGYTLSSPIVNDIAVATRAIWNPNSTLGGVSYTNFGINTTPQEYNGNIGNRLNYRLGNVYPNGITYPNGVTYPDATYYRGFDPNTISAYAYPPNRLEYTYPYNYYGSEYPLASYECRSH